MTRTAMAVCALALAIDAAQGSAEIPAALRAMADAERAFAAAAREKGIRDAFLEFFTDDAMFEPGGGLAKEQLRKQKPEPSSVRELIWEPRTGDVAASGDLGWRLAPARSSITKRPTRRRATRTTCPSGGRSRTVAGACSSISARA